MSFAFRYLFNNGSGSTVNDQSVNGLNATITNPSGSGWQTSDIPYTSGYANNLSPYSYLFNGTDESMEAEPTSSWNSESFSLTLWVKKAAAVTGVDEAIFSSSNNTNNFTWQLDTNATGSKWRVKIKGT